MIIGVSGKIGSGKDTVGSIIQYLYYEHSDINIDNKLSYKEFVKTDRTNNILISSVVPEIKKYADKLKDIVCILLSCTREQLEDREFKENLLGEEWWYYIHPINGDMIPYINSDSLYNETSTLIKLTPRLLLQLIGTECGRQIIHPNIWVNATMIDYVNNETYSDLGNLSANFKYSNWIITDVRFPNEADAITKCGGINIRIQKPNKDLYNYCGNVYNLENLFKIVHEDTGEYPIKSYADNNWKIQPALEHESETALDLYKFDYIVNHGTIEALIEQVREILIKENII